MTARLILSIAMLAGVMFPASRLLAQNDTLRPLRNIVEVFNSRNNALNGVYPGITPHYHTRGIKARWGASYIRLIGRRQIGVEFSFHEWYWGADIENWPSPLGAVGYVWTSSSTYYCARLHYPIMSRPQIKLYASGGGAFRTGGETIVVQQGSNGIYGWRDWLFRHNPMLKIYLVFLLVVTAYVVSHLHKRYLQLMGKETEGLSFFVFGREYRWEPSFFPFMFLKKRDGEMRNALFVRRAANILLSVLFAELLLFLVLFFFV